jgi:hypothetical protein
MDFFSRIFKKNTLTKTGLEEAKEKGLITNEEYFRLKRDRADEDLAKFISSKKAKK